MPSIAFVLVCELARAYVLVPLGLNATVIREGFTKKVARLLDFVQMRGGDCPFFCPFHKCIFGQ